MNNHKYVDICDHLRIKRIDNNFVRCYDCGQSMISQKNMLINKSRKDFTKENKSFVRNFDRNFTNVLEEVDENSANPLYEYYTDRMRANIVVVNRTPQFFCQPPKFEVMINGSKSYQTDGEINKILSDINAFRIDEGLVKH